ncbi:BLOC-2 complex member HPS6 [Hyperolius riggenbachi]|uniref:BLOC-2 complex member HPS6 n=1 Tax=Hyperolius riggenbachi TaxID=752182 RepID=UPI0035A34C9F
MSRFRLAVCGELGRPVWGPSSSAPPPCGLLALPGPVWLLVWESGRAEVWLPPRGPSEEAGWRLLQSLELCRGARVLSVCSLGGARELLWCEERRSSSLASYCVCRRGLTVTGQHRVILGNARILLHHSPRYALATAAGASPGHVYMVPPSSGPTAGAPRLVYMMPPSSSGLTATGASGHVYMVPPSSSRLTVGAPGHIYIVPPSPGPPSSSGQVYMVPPSPGSPSDAGLRLISESPSSRHVHMVPPISGSPSNARHCLTLGFPSDTGHHLISESPSSSDHISTVPDPERPPILVYSPTEETITLSSVPIGTILRRALPEGEADYKKLSLDYLGLSAHQMAADIRQHVVTAAGDLLLMTTTGQIYLLHPKGSVRHVCDLDAEISGCHPVEMDLFGDLLACAVGSKLHLIDAHTGRLIETLPLNAEEVFFLRGLETDDIQLLTKTGIYKVLPAASGEEDGTSESALMEMVYEEACKYYQRRSLSSTKLTVQTLKKEGMFQTPITLSAILSSCQKTGKLNAKNKYADLMNNLSNELQSFLSLELLKSRIVGASGTEMGKYCNELIDLEITRLLQMDLDREGLLYINYLFCTFPKSAWMSLRNNFQFQQNGDGKLVILATADLWKKVLSPLPTGTKDESHNGVYPLYEVICQSLCTYKPKWLPGFVQHAQEYSGLSRNFTKDNCEGLPLYKRAMSVLNRCKENTNVDLEVEILLCSGRPQAIIQAIHTLIRLQRWPRVIEETLRYSHHPMIKKDIFITLLVELVQCRDLDPFVPQLCDICPEDMTATDVLRIVLQNIPKTPTEPSPFCDGEHLTVGLLKPLLHKVLQNQLRKENVTSPTYPPAAPQRQPDTQNPVVNGADMSPTDFYSTKPL